MAHEAAFRALMTYSDTATGHANAIAHQPPRTPEDWQAKRASTDAVLTEIGGVVTRVGDETVGEVWSLLDGQDLLNEIDPRFSENLKRHVDFVTTGDPFHV